MSGSDPVATGDGEDRLIRRAGTEVRRRRLRLSPVPATRPPPLTLGPRAVATGRAGRSSLHRSPCPAPHLPIAAANLADLAAGVEQRRCDCDGLVTSRRCLATYRRVVGRDPSRGPALVEPVVAVPAGAPAPHLDEPR